MDSWTHGTNLRDEIIRRFNAVDEPMRFADPEDILGKPQVVA